MTDHDRRSDASDEQGQVSEVARMPADGEAEVSDEQSVAGNPDSPRPEELGEIGPGANQFRDRPGR